MIYPKFPEAGDVIGITAPSAGVGYKLDSFDRSVRTLKDQGYAIHETDSVRMEGVRSNYADIRAEEFNSLIADRDVKAVIAAAGGDYNIEVLPHIDWKAVRKNPKWICGASDPTNILYTITTRYDVATLYGFNAGSFDWSPLHQFQLNALAILRGNLLRQDSFDMYDKIRDFSVDTPVLDEPVYWDLRTPSGVDSVDVEGRLIGGCIDCIAKLIGTPYDGTAGFVDKYRNIIWYFDVFEMTSEDLYRTMLQMKYCGYFAGTRAVVFGRVMFPGDDPDSRYLEHLQRVFQVPVIWNADIGHVKPCMTLINGSVARIRCADGKGSIEMRLE